MITDTAPLTLETCDRCGPYVSARYTVTLPSGYTLTLCAHHARTLAIPDTAMITEIESVTDNEREAIPAN